MPAAASADGLSLGLDGCPARPTEHTFARWLDLGNYTPVPGGTFEGSLSGWKLTGGAKVVVRQRVLQRARAGEKLALSLPGGSSATTPAMCMGVLDPTLRYFAANDGGLLSLLDRPDPLLPAGRRRDHAAAGINVGGKSWAPSLPTVVAPNLLGVLNGGDAQVPFRFTPTGLGAKWRIDDVYVDPRASH